MFMIITSTEKCLMYLYGRVFLGQTHQSADCVFESTLCTLKECEIVVSLIIVEGRIKGTAWNVLSKQELYKK